MNFVNKYKLEITVFIVGAVVLILEIVGSRVVAPYIGTSIIVWTSLIGVVLGSLSLGYYCGGRLADNKANYKILSLVIFIAALFVGYINLVKELVFSLIASGFLDLRLQSLFVCLVLFVPANVFLGIVSPYAVKLKVCDLKKTGMTVGNLYAISTMGSIFGVFISGFFLISIIGSTKIIYLLSIVLIITSLFLYGLNFLKPRVGVLVVFLILLFMVTRLEKVNAKKGFIDSDTEYSRVWIYNTLDWKTKKPIKVMSIEPKGYQSGVFLDSDDLVFDYTKFFGLAAYFKPDFKNSLMIGGAAYTFPRDYLIKYPDAKIDVVEIDPGMTKLAMDHFRLKENDRLNIYHEDGRVFLNRTQAKYDVVFIDAFSSAHSIPFQLTTKETVENINSLLSVNGVVLVNTISAVDGTKGRFMQSAYKTYKSVFSNVYLFPIKYPDSDSKVQNIMLVATNNETISPKLKQDGEFGSYLSHLWTGEIESGGQLLTDDFAPVDQYMVELLTESSR